MIHVVVKCGGKKRLETEIQVQIQILPAPSLLTFETFFLHKMVTMVALKDCVRVNENFYKAWGYLPYLAYLLSSVIFILKYW